MVVVGVVVVAAAAAAEEEEVKDVDISYVALWARGHGQHERNQEQGRQTRLSHAVTCIRCILSFQPHNQHTWYMYIIQYIVLFNMLILRFSLESPDEAKNAQTSKCS